MLHPFGYGTGRSPPCGTLYQGSGGLAKQLLLFPHTQNATSLIQHFSPHNDPSIKSFTRERLVRNRSPKCIETRHHHTKRYPRIRTPTQKLLGAIGFLLWSRICNRPGAGPTTLQDISPHNHLRRCPTPRQILRYKTRLCDRYKSLPMVGSM